MDEISLFVHQLLLRSSSSSSPPPSYSSIVGLHSQHSSDNQSTPRESVISKEYEVHASSTILCDARTKAGFSAFLEEEVPKGEPSLPRPRNSSSKRSRAAEVHNMAEKRRRSRINEKMKALQKLIPNSNRTDKASMLDEAIEYLKQLQLQVQMLSMRNRISLHSICLPEPLEPSNDFQTRFDLGGEKPSQNLSTMDSLAINQASRPQRMSNPQKKCTLSNQLFVPALSNVLNLKTSCGSHASFQDHVGAFPLCKSFDLGSVVTPMSNHATGDSENLATLGQCSSREVHKEDDLPPKYFESNHSTRTLSEELGIGAIFASSFPSEKSASNMKDCSQEASLICRGQTDVLLENSKGNHAHFLDLDTQITPSYATKRKRLAS